MKYAGFEHVLLSDQSAMISNICLQCNIPLFNLMGPVHQEALTDTIRRATAA